MFIERNQLPLAALLAAGLFGAASAEAANFNRVASWPVSDNLAEGEAMEVETAAEILAASGDGMTLLYSDSPAERLGFLDITDPAAPTPAGFVQLSGEPTSVAVAGGYALVGVNSSKSYVEPSGHVALVSLSEKKVLARCDVKGQPDSLAVSPDGRYLAVVVENERDEELNDGVIPQLPAGHLAVLTLNGEGRPTNCGSASIVPLTGFAAIAPEDPEPEYVSVNSANQALVTLQENNHIVLVDLPTATVAGHFSAGTTDLTQVDATKDKVISLTESLSDVRREPDAVAWIDDERFVIANEGDYEGGSRGFTVFNTRGQVLYESGNAVEHLAVSIGHYPEKRAGKKGTEPEGVAVATFGGETIIFLGMERAGFLALYGDGGEAAAPAFRQVLPSGLKPEGILPIPSRGLLAVANEDQDPEEGIRSTVTLYRYADFPAAYPQVVSTQAANGAPIPWGALSGLVADAEQENILYAVPDSFYANSGIYTLDVSQKPAKITAFLPLSKEGAPVSYDLEGITLAGDGGFWLVSEGHPGKELANLLVKVSASGEVEQEVALPEALAAEAERFGFEGVTRDGGTLLIALQREWKDDPKGQVKLALYDSGSGEWSFLAYPLDAVESPVGGWVGLSEIVAVGDQRYWIVERDNKQGPDARIKRIYEVSLAGVSPAPYGEELPLLEKSLVSDTLSLLASGGAWTPDKLEGLAVTREGRVFIVTDNDGVDDSNGETRFFQLSVTLSER